MFLTGGEGQCLHVVQHGSGCAGGLTYGEEARDDQQGQQVRCHSFPHLEYRTRWWSLDHRERARQLKSMARSEVRPRTFSRRASFPVPRRRLHGRNMLFWKYHVYTHKIHGHSHTLRAIPRKSAWNVARHHPLGNN